MDIFAFTDVHCRQDVMLKIISNIQKYKPDVIVDCGDLSWFGKGLNINVKKLNELNIPILIIHGNHESEEDFMKLQKRYKNIIYLHKKSYIIGKYVFFGYGGSGFSTQDKTLENLIPQVKKTLKRTNKFIFITHMPVADTKLDDLGEIGHVGSISSRKFVEQLKPILVLSGHIHENEKKKDKVNNTLLVNPGTGLLLKI